MLRSTAFLLALATFLPACGEASRPAEPPAPAIEEATPPVEPARDAGAPYVPAGGIAWEPDLATAQSRAAETGRPVLAYFTFDT